MLVLSSPAKINLFLRILRRRSDGYHDLASLFQTISLFDRLHFSFGLKDVLTCSDSQLSMDDSNLVSKALALFRKKTGLTKSVVIHLEKNIPQQAGLGGGSSNAATTLWALNQLFDQPVSIDDLRKWGGELGSDVAFFLSSGTAFCTGRGEVVRDVPPLSKQKVTIIKPPFGLSTPEVYKNLNLSLLNPRDPEEALDSFYEEKPIYFNDMESAAFAINPQLKLIKDELQKSGFSEVHMSGSGSSFFCLGNGKIKDKSLLKTFYFIEAEFINSSNWY